MKMKRLLMTAMGLLLPLAMLWAGGSGSLFVNNKNGLNSGVTKQFVYNGTTYTGQQMSGDDNCYFYQLPNNGKKLMLMDNATIRFIQGTKSWQDVVIIIRGRCKISCGNHSTVGIENGDIAFQGETASNIPQLTIEQTGSYHCLFSTKGSITFKDINVTFRLNSKSKRAISQETSNGKLYLDNCNLSYSTSNTYEVYARGGIKTTNCGFFEGDKIIYSKTKYYVANLVNGQANGICKAPEVIRTNSTHPYYSLDTDVSALPQLASKITTAQYNAQQQANAKARAEQEAREKAAQQAAAEKAAAAKEAALTYYVSGVNTSRVPVVVNSKWKTFTYNAGDTITHLGVNKRGVWALVRRGYIRFTDRPEFTLYNNTQLSKRYVPNTGGYTSMVMRVKGDDVVVVGVNTQDNKNSEAIWESRICGEVNNCLLFETAWNHKDHRGNKAYKVELETAFVYHLMDCDYYGGKIYATGWVDREFHDTSGMVWYWDYRDCARIWENGKEIVQQVENATSHANAIDVVRMYKKNSTGMVSSTGYHVETTYLTCGDFRGDTRLWDGSNDAKKSNIGPVTRQAVYTDGSAYNWKRVVICNDRLYDENLNLIQGPSSNDQFQDVVTYDNKVYALSVDKTTKKVNVWLVSGGKATLKFLFSTTQVGDSNLRLAVYEQ